MVHQVFLATWCRMKDTRIYFNFLLFYFQKKIPTESVGIFFFNSFSFGF